MQEFLNTAEEDEESEGQDENRIAKSDIEKLSSRFAAKSNSLQSPVEGVEDEDQNDAQEPAEGTSQCVRKR